MKNNSAAKNGDLSASGRFGGVDVDLQKDIIYSRTQSKKKEDSDKCSGKNVKKLKGNASSISVLEINQKDLWNGKENRKPARASIILN